MKKRIDLELVFRRSLWAEFWPYIVVIMLGLSFVAGAYLGGLRGL